MPIRLPQDTAALFAAHADKFDSRSLLLDRFVYDHPDMDEARKLHFAQVCPESFGTIASTRQGWQAEIRELQQKENRERDQRRRQRLREDHERIEGFLTDTAEMAARRAVCSAEKPDVATASWRTFLDSLPDKKVIHAQLQSRLMVNMAGGVMENAGLCLDRFGLPYIPGSAVKGCARRAALAALHEWCEADRHPGHKPCAPDNPLAPCCAAFTSPADMLAAIAQIFGWCELDWSDRSDQSDFRWAGDSCWPDLQHQVTQRLCAHFQITPKKPDRPWESLPNFAGSVSFLPAYPVDLGKTGKVDSLPLEVPALGKLELDVVTVHHKKYYEEPAEPKDVPHSDEKWQRWKREHDAWERQWGTAPDIEEPVPNVFPAVAPGHIFTFALVPLRNVDEKKLVEHARTWLKTGLETFGLGAKTNAGYGWFCASDAVHEAVQKVLQDKARRERETRERERAEKKRKEQEAQKLREKQARDAVLASLSGDERADKEIELLTESQFDAKVLAFCKEPKKGGPTEDQKKAIVRALRGARLDYWQSFKSKATKGELARVDQAIRQLSKQMNLGKMP